MRCTAATPGIIAHRVRIAADRSARIVRWMIASFAAAALVITLTGVAAAATIGGQVRSLTGRALPNVVVYIDSVPGVTFSPPEEHALMDQRNLEFVPRILPVLTGTTVDFLNSDRVLHNIFTPDSVGDDVNLGSYPTGEIRSHTFTKSCRKACDALMLCNVHPDMEAYIVVLNNPYYAVSDSTGAFRIDGVPPGDYTLRTWDANRAETETAVHVAADTVSIDFVLPPHR